MVKEFIKAAKNGDAAKIAELLVAQPSLIGARDSDDSTALHCAAWKGHADIVKLLLAAGANVNAHNANGDWAQRRSTRPRTPTKPPLPSCCSPSGADVNALDLNGQPPLNHTTFHKATAAAKVLRKHGEED